MLRKCVGIGAHAFSEKPLALAAAQAQRGGAARKSAWRRLFSN
jgi:predicted dehydrogenase